MKNKEIEELLNDLKWYASADNKPDYNGEYPPPMEWEQGDVKLLLSRMEQLENKYDKALETLVDFNIPCERNDFNLIDTDYCELNCSVDDEQYKKCWNRWIEWRLENEINERNVN